MRAWNDYGGKVEFVKGGSFFQTPNAEWDFKDIGAESSAFAL